MIDNYATDTIDIITTSMDEWGKVTETTQSGISARVEDINEMVKDLKRGMVGGWMNIFTDDDRRLFERIAQEELIRWGYEVSGS